MVMESSKGDEILLVIILIHNYIKGQKEATSMEGTAKIVACGRNYTKPKMHKLIFYPCTFTSHRYLIL